MPAAPPSPLPLLRLSGVTIRAFGRQLFAGTTWQILPGQQWAVLGGTGSGKSALLRALLGELPVGEGRIDYGLDGRRRREGEYAPGAVELVSVDQHRAVVAASLDFHQARWSPAGGRDPVAAGDLLRAAGRPRRHGRQLAALLEIGPLLGRSVGSLSNGEMRKVLLARALRAGPRLLLLDDPYAGLDTASRRRLAALVQRLMRAGTAVVLATARPDEVPAAATHVLFLDRGRVARAGPRRPVLADPRVRALARAAQRPPRLPRLRWHQDGGGPAPGTPIVEIHRADVTYGRARILRQVSWTVRAGESWVLSGRNGSGKSTLLSLITGDNPQAYANDVRLFGVPRGSGESIWEIRQRQGWLAPELQFHYCGEVTCWEVVCSGLYDTVGLYRESSRREAAAVRRWLANLQVANLADTPFGALSDGQQRLVLLARALVKEPPLLLFDEPCQGLDPAHRARVLGLIDQMARQPHTTVVYVTHHREEIPPSFDRELRLGRGRVLYRGAR